MLSQYDHGLGPQIPRIGEPQFRLELQERLWVGLWAWEENAGSSGLFLDLLQALGLSCPKPPGCEHRPRMPNRVFSKSWPTPFPAF